jgi:hypothetical protein
MRLKRLISWATLQPLSGNAADAIREIRILGAGFRFEAVLSRNGGSGFSLFRHKSTIFAGCLRAD